MFTSEFKAKVILQELIGVKSQAEICQEHQIEPQLFSSWKAEFLERVFSTQPSRGDEQRRIAELEQMVGRLTMELKAAKEGREY